jgi:hypothetical protein
VLFWCLLELEIGSHMSSLARSFSKLIRRLSPFGHVHMSPEARSKRCPSLEIKIDFTMLLLHSYKPKLDCEDYRKN